MSGEGRPRRLAAPSSRAAAASSWRRAASSTAISCARRTSRIRAICFIGSASGDAESARYKFYEAMATLDCRATHLSLIQPPTSDLAGFVLEQDAIYVGGGNTRSLLALWREWGLDVALRAAYERGVVLGGISAGMICWFEYGITDSVPGTCRRCAASAGSPAAHARTTTARRSAGRRSIACSRGRIPPGYAADDGAALHFVDEQLAEVVVAGRGRGVPVDRRAGRGRRERAAGARSRLNPSCRAAALDLGMAHG